MVALGRAGRGRRTEIDYAGPGLFGAESERALQRNECLVRGRYQAEESCLGLAVVRDIAESNRWRLDSRSGHRIGASIRPHLSARWRKKDRRGGAQARPFQMSIAASFVSKSCYRARSAFDSGRNGGRERRTSYSSGVPQKRIRSEATRT